MNFGQIMATALSATLLMAGAAQGQAPANPTADQGHVSAGSDSRESRAAARAARDAADDARDATVQATQAADMAAAAARETSELSADDHQVASDDHDDYRRRPPPNRELVRVGADTLMDGPLGKKKDQGGFPVPLLSERLDGCLWPPVEQAGVKFRCVAQATRSAARAYRRMAGIRQWETDAFTTGAAGGLTVVAIGVGHAAKDSLNAWTAVGLLPLIMDDLASPGPRARLYNVAAIALTVTVVRAESLHAALGVVGPRMRGGDLQQRVRSACDPTELAKLDPAKIKPSLKDAEKKAADKLNASIATRCDELAAASTSW